MKLKEIMTRNVRGIDKSEAIHSAAQVMTDMEVGAIPVFEQGKLVGIVTDRDIVTRAVARGRDCATTAVGEIMTADPVTLSDETNVNDVVREMERRQIRRVLVHGPDHEIVGIIALGDLATRTHNQRLSGECIEKISVPCEPVGV